MEPDRPVLLLDMTLMYQVVNVDNVEATAFLFWLETPKGH